MNIDTLGKTTFINSDLTEIFKCAPQGGIRRAHATNTLVVISDHTKSLFDDKQIGDVFHYTGQGQVGNQTINYMQNRTINESRTNGIEMHFFEVFKSAEYIYRGIVELHAKPYQEEQQDLNGNLRIVWIFPLKIINSEGHLLDEKIIDESEVIQEKKISKMSDADIVSYAQRRSSTGNSRRTASTTYIRDPYIAEHSRRVANGVCQLCMNNAPFNTKSGYPYLESHHIVWLSKKGEDSIQNTIALCPNCHKKMHIVNDSSDVETLKRRNIKNISV